VMLLSDRDQIQSEPLTVVLLVCFLLNETLREENPMGSGCAVCVHSVRDNRAAAAAIAGVAEASFGSAGYAQRRSRDSYLDCSNRYE
jgi:hypothetical protein